MKKLISVLAVLTVLTCLIITPALAQSKSLKEMSFDELILLQKQINKEIMSRPEWKEVTVPVGTWKVGEDIPAGTYSVSGGKFMATLTIYKNEDLSFSSMVNMYTFSGMTSTTVGKITLHEGEYIVVETEPLVFAPPQSLGF